MMDQRRSPVLCRLFDASPFKCRYGRLQNRVMKYARYPILREDKTWTTATYDAMVAAYPRKALPRSGILELLAQGFTCHYSMPNGEMRGFRSFIRPLLMQNGSGSVIYRAVERGVPQFNLEGLRTVKRHCPYLCVLKVPDACSANARANEQFSEDLNSLGDEAFEIKGKCGGHQLHRIIEGSEKEMCGNVHAVFMTCSHPGNQNRIQKALWDRLNTDEFFDYTVGVPDPEIQKRNWLIVKRTLLRRQYYVAKDALTSVDNTKVQRAKRLQTVWNGDWAIPRKYMHICNGCHTSKADARDDMFASVIENDITQGSDVDKPSLDDWYSCGECCGKTSIGLLMHNVLEDTLNAALPTWGQMLPPNYRRRSGTGAEVFRMRLQKKAWRSKCFLGDPCLRRKCLNLCWLAAPLECCSSRLQYLDEHSRTGLWDIQQASQRNPFWAARVEIASMLKRGVNGPLGLICSYIKPEEHWLALHEMRTMGMEINAQIKFRFLVLEGFPTKLTVLADRAATEKRKSDTLRDFYLLKDCCRDNEFSKKVFRIFWAPSFEDFEHKILTDADFRAMLEAVVFCWRFCNMWCERLLALVRNYTALEGATCERMGATGLLGQMLTEHLRAGGDDPRSINRAQLLEDGVPLLCQKDLKIPALCGSFPMWMKRQEEERREAGIRLDRKAYLE